MWFCKKWRWVLVLRINLMHNHSFAPIWSDLFRPNMGRKWFAACMTGPRLVCDIASLSCGVCEFKLGTKK